MKTIEELIKERAIALPYKENDLEAAYRLGQINMILELVNNLKGYPVNGLVRGIITEDQLTDKLVEVSNV